MKINLIKTEKGQQRKKKAVGLMFFWTRKKYQSIDIIAITKKKLISSCEIVAEKQMMKTMVLLLISINRQINKEKNCGGGGVYLLVVPFGYAEGITEVYGGLSPLGVGYFGENDGNHGTVQHKRHHHLHPQQHHT